MTAQTATDTAATDTAATDTAAGKTVPMTQAIIILAGAELRRIVTAEPTALNAATVRRIGNLDIQLCRTGDTWRLYLQSMTPVPHSTRDLWATAVSAPSVEWGQTPDGCLVWCEWMEPARKAI